MWACKPTTGFWQYECKSGREEADRWCQAKAGKKAVFMDCEGYGDEVGESETGAAAPSWDPSSYISVDSNGHYLVDEAFVALLKADPGLIFLDSARVDMNSAGYLELESVAQGDLADVLGLQSGDALVSVNGYSLASLDDLADAYSALENATTFALTISRNGQPMTLTYVVN